MAVTILVHRESVASVRRFAFTAKRASPFSRAARVHHTTSRVNVEFTRVILVSSMLAVGPECVIWSSS